MDSELSYCHRPLKVEPDRVRELILAAIFAALDATEDQRLRAQVDLYLSIPVYT